MKKIFLAVLSCLLLNITVKAQLAINEVSQGASGNKEFIELVVVGARTCSDSCADLRGWIVDDNGGWFGSSAISQGCYRFSNSANWSCVPYGAIIVLYNSGEKNDNITQADDPTDTNPHDGVYIVPVTSAYIELNGSSPNSSMGTSFSYPATGFGASTTWTNMALNNNGDAVVTVKPTALNTPYTAITYGNINGGIHLSSSGSQKVYYATGSQYNSPSGWTFGSVSAAETPGVANTAANLAWINGMKQVGPGGALNVTINDTVCQGSSYVFNGTVLTTAGTYKDTLVAIAGCDSVITLHLAVRPRPLPPTVVTPVSYCQSATALSLSATGQGIRWYTIPVGGTGTVQAPLPVTTVAGTTTWYVSQTVNGCESERDSIKVVIKPTPAAPVVTTPVQYCLHEPAAALTAIGQDLLWYTGAPGSIGSPVAPVPATTVAGTVRYYVTQSPGGCESPRVAIDVITHEAVAGFTVSKDSLCASDTLVCTNTSTGAGLTYAWDFGDGSTAATANPAHIYTLSGNYFVRLIITSANGCKDTAGRYVKVLPLPAFDFTLSDTVVCQGQAVKINSSFSPGYLYADWDFGDGETISRADVPVHAYETAGKYTISVKARYAVCPEKNKSRFVDVLAYPKTDIGPDTAICPGSHVFYLQDAYYNPAYHYTWNTGETTDRIMVTHPGRYWLTAGNGQCSSTDSVTIFKSCYIDIPNAFSPNGDGVNDYFFPRQLLSKAISSFHMQVWNRWGQVMFETRSADGRGWDGRFNDIAQPSGVYIYLIEVVFANGAAENYQGNVTMVR